MPSERVQRQIDRLLDGAEDALTDRDWPRVRNLAQDALALEPDNEDALAFCRRAGYRPELAGSLCDYADKLLDPSNSVRPVRLPNSNIVGLRPSEEPVEGQHGSTSSPRTEEELLRQAPRQAEGGQDERMMTK